MEFKLASLGHDVVAVSDGAAAVDACDAAPPDMVVLDVMMPGMSGPSWPAPDRDPVGRSALRSTVLSGAYVIGVALLVLSLALVVVLVAGRVGGAWIEGRRTRRDARVRQLHLVA